MRFDGYSSTIEAISKVVEDAKTEGKDAEISASGKAFLLEQALEKFA